MGLEIEKKFLVDVEKLNPFLQRKSSVVIQQGFLSMNKDKIVRIRTYNDLEGYITIKGSGFSVAGCLVHVDEIKILDRQTPWDDDFVQQLIKDRQIYIDRARSQYEFIKSMPKGLSSERWDKLAMKRTVRSAMKSLEKEERPENESFKVKKFEWI